MARPLHRKDVKNLLVGLVAVALAASIAKVGTTVQSGGALPLKSYVVVNAAFKDVGTLKPQQNVKEDGVRVGQVTAIAYRDGEAHVTMRLDGGVEVYRNAIVRVGNESALGRKFLAIDPGTPTAGVLGSTELPASQTRSTIDVNDILAAFPPSARNGLGSTLRNVGLGVDGAGAGLNRGVAVAPTVLDQAQQILTAVNDPSTDVNGLISQADTLVSQLRGNERSISALVKDTGLTLSAVNTGKTAPLRETLQQAPSTLRTASDGLARINPALDHAARAVSRLKPGVGDLVKAMPDLRGFLTQSPPVAVTVVHFADEAAPAVQSLVPAIHDAQYAVQHLTEALGMTDPILRVLAPYAPDAGTLFSENNLLSGNYGPTKHYFAAMLVFPGLYNVSLPDPLAKVSPYEGPGRAFADGLDYKK